jgi:uncharacterized repeat protein (TIGR01451 family)
VKIQAIRTRRSVWALLAGSSALLLAVILLLLLFRSDAVAQPAADATDLIFDKRVSAAAAAPGDTLTYVIEIQETGSAVTLWMTDTLPDEVTYVPDSLDYLGPPDASYGYADGVVTWNIPSLSFNQTALITFTVEISSEITYAEVENTAQVDNGAQLFEDSATTTVSIASGNLDNAGTYKQVSSSAAQPGDVLTYTVRLYNDGTDPALSPHLTDVLHPALTCIPGSLSASLGSIDCTGGTITWSHDQVYSSQQIMLHYSAQISATYEGVITNTAEIASSGQSFVRSTETDVGLYGPFTFLPVLKRQYPPVPLLYPIPEPDPDDNSYTVSWSPVTVAFDNYVLQEASDAGFTDVTGEWETTQTLKNFVKGSLFGSFYYRVRVDNSSRWGQGPWSNVEGATAWGYSDNFSNYQSGWPREWEKTRGALYQVRPYEHPKCPGDDCDYDEGNGYVIARRSGSKPYARFGPKELVPSGDYEIEVDVRWWEAAYFATYQILFGSDKDFDEYYALQVRINIVGDSRDCSYSLIRHTSSALAEDGTLSVESDKTLQDWSYSSNINCNIGSKKRSSSFDHWKIRRENDEITIWVNGKNLGDWDDSKFGADRYFGVGATLYEGFTPSKPEFDNWSVVLR